MVRISGVLAAVALGLAALHAQPPAPAAAQAGRASGASSGPQIPPIQETGFQPIFDGKSLSGWDGDAEFWRVEDGALVGQTTTSKQPKQNTFLIWRGGNPADFELRLSFRLTGYNSGIQFRSIELPDIKWAMKGYQADMDGEQRYTGQIYEERGRGFLAMRGQFTYIGDGQKPALVGSLGDANELKKLIHGEGWNDLHLIARGNTIEQVLNGRLMSMLIDDDTAGRKMDGLIGIQVHRGPAMKIEVKNIRLKKL
jgi:hypothetical protein